MNQAPTVANRMMRRSMITVVAIALIGPATSAQDHTGATAAPAEALSQPGGQDRIIRRGMGVLGSWAVLNLIGGTTGALLAEDPATSGFWEMNALWNTVNLGLAGGTLIARERRSDPDGTLSLTLPEYHEESHRFEKVLLFNAGLDIGYMAIGGWMWERGSRGYGLPASGVSAERLTGWGQALVLQGAFLFVFDVVVARRLARDRVQVQ